MNSTKNKSNTKIFVISILMIALFSLTACSSGAPESAPIDQQSDVYVPVVENNVSESDDFVSGEVSEAYPGLEQETQIPVVEDTTQNTAYPDPETEQVSMMESEDLQEEADPVSQEEPTQVIKPTPRGNELVATIPSTVILDSGKIQLVELFAFW